jgi:hypothetical protein
MSETELNKPFTRLVNLFSPLVDQLSQVPENNEDALRLIVPE